VPDDPREAIVARLKERLEDRKRSGLYPREMLEDLDAFGRDVAPALAPPPDYVTPLRDLLARLTSLRFDISYPTTSRVPGGSTLHGTIAKVQARQAEHLAEQVRVMTDAVSATLDGVLTALEHPTAHEHNEIENHLAALRTRVDAVDRASRLGTSTDVLARLERLEAAERARDFRPFFSNAAFEDAFRGSQEDLRAQYAPLADRLEGPVLDIGCGQGFFLSLLKERGIEARGVELDAELAAKAPADLDVVQGDGLAVLDATPDRSLGAIVLLQVVEHLSAQQLCDLILLAATKLRTGGILAAETVNPQSLYVFAHAFYIDPTHSRPIHPLYLRFLCEQAGFTTADLEFAGDVPADEMLPADGGELATRANALLFGPQDYLLLASR
jgi:O-antigen chain-terminating methyltransferase